MMTTEAVSSLLQDVERSSKAVQSFVFERGPDATGGDAVWVWLTLHDEAFDFATTEHLREQIQKAVLERGGEQAPWFYVRFRGASEKVPN